MELKGKVALVTGSSRGIGKTIALELARKGCKVIVHGPQDSDDLCRSFEEVKKLSRDSIMVTADFSKPAAIDKMFSQITMRPHRTPVLFWSLRKRIGTTCFLLTSRRLFCALNMRLK